MREPDDYDVKFRLIAILTPGLSTEEKKQAVSYANDLIRIDAKRPSAYSALGGVYYRSWLISKSRDDAEKSIAAYRRYLQLAPANDTFRPQAQSIIAMMQKK